MFKKPIKLITNEQRMLDLAAMGLTPNDAVILNLKKSTFEILEDPTDVELIKKSAVEDNKTILVIVKEAFPAEQGAIENLEDFKLKNTKVFKAFKKNPNVLFFFGNISADEQIYGIDDGRITMSDPSFFDEFDEEKSRLIQAQLQAEEDRKRMEAELLLQKEAEDKLALEEDEKEMLLNREAELDQLNKNLEASGISNLMVQDQARLMGKNVQYDENGNPVAYTGADGQIYEGGQYGMTSNNIITNDFDQEFDQLTKEENEIPDYPILDSKEYLLKSIYDFIWRMLILNNSDLLLNDLLYLSINNFPSLSHGQNEFIRELSNEADSLFDIILKLDYKLQFNNKLFYIYLANLFTVINGVCKVNRKFLFDISVWLSDEARENFVTRTENYMNNNLVSIEKIIYSHFIEFSSIVQGSIPRIRGSLKYEDIHLILYRKVQNSRNRNLFCIIIRNLFRASHEIGLELQTIILNEENIQNLDSQLKMDIANAYNLLLGEIRNFIFLRGANEVNIPKLYNILMSIGIEQIINEKVEIVTIADLVNKEQVEIEDDYFKYINSNKSRNEVVNIKYEEIEALYKEAAKSEKQRNINDEIYEFDLDSIRDGFLNERKSRFDKDYGINKELSLSSIKTLKETEEISEKMDSFESEIKANIKLMEEQRKLMKERIAKYSSPTKDPDLIKLK
ncbi:MAG: hypothetical protein ACRCVI_01920 [Mycoplasmoidaceae bacterium]